MSVHASDGTQGGIIGFLMIVASRLNLLIMDLSLEQVFSRVVLAVIGSVAGFITHLILKYFERKFKK